MSVAIDHKIIVLIRHAKAVSSYGDYRDIDRPLTAKGQSDALKMAIGLKEKLHTLSCTPDLLLSSPAKRTEETANIFSNVFEYDSSKIEFDPHLYLPQVDSFYELIEKVIDEVNVLFIFSHNNGITDFVNTLTNNRIDVIPPCGMVVVKVDDKEWKNIRIATKEWCWFKAPSLTY